MMSTATIECIQGSLDVQAYLYGVYCRIPRLRFLSLCVNLAASMADVARGEQKASKLFHLKATGDWTRRS